MDRLAEIGRCDYDEPGVKAQPFVTIRCPACGSADVRAQAAGRFSCQHCQSSFLYAGTTGGGSNLNAGSGDLGGQQAVTRSAALLVTVVGLVIAVFAVAFFFLFFAVGEQVVAVVDATTTAVEQRAGPATVATPSARVVPSHASSAVKPPTSPGVFSRPEITPTPARPPERPAAPEPVDLADYQRLIGCECSAKSARKIVELRARGTGNATTISGSGMQVTRGMAFVLAATGEEPWLLPVSDDTAPAARYAVNEFTLGVGCNGDTVVVASGKTLSAWSRATRALLWSQTLPGSFGVYRERPGPDLELRCESLRLAKDVATVRAGGKSVRFALLDGAPR